jgi:hypothetical protein
LLIREFLCAQTAVVCSSLACCVLVAVCLSTAPWLRALWVILFCGGGCACSCRSWARVGAGFSACPFGTRRDDDSCAFEDECDKYDDEDVDDVDVSVYERAEDERSLPFVPTPTGDGAGKAPAVTAAVGVTSVGVPFATAASLLLAGDEGAEATNRYGVRTSSGAATVAAVAIAVVVAVVVVVVVAGVVAVDAVIVDAFNAGADTDKSAFEADTRDGESPGAAATVFIIEELRTGDAAGDA